MREKFTTTIDSELLQEAKKRAIEENVNGTNDIIEKALSLYLYGKKCYENSAWKNEKEYMLKFVIIEKGQFARSFCIDSECITKYPLENKRNQKIFSEEELRKNGYVKI